MPKFFSLPESLARTKEEKVKEKKWVEKTGEVVGKKGFEDDASSPPKTPRVHNKLHKPRPFSLAVPSSRKRTTSHHSAIPTSVHIPSLTTDSSSDSSSTDPFTGTATATTPTKVKSEPKHHRLRTISLRSVRSISSSLKHRYSHSHLSSSSGASTTSSSESSIGESTMAPSVVTLNGDSISPSASPMKGVPHKVVSKVKKSIRRLGSHLHLPHVTPHSPRLRAVSDSAAESSGRLVDFDTPSSPPQDTTTTDLDAESVHSRRASSTRAHSDETDAEHSTREEGLGLALEGVGAHSSYEHSEAVSGELLLVVPSILSPVEEIPTPLEPIAIRVENTEPVLEAPRVDTTVTTEVVESDEEDNAKPAEEKEMDREKENPADEPQLDLSEADKHTVEAVSVAAPEPESVVAPSLVDQDVPLSSSEGPSVAEEEESLYPPAPTFQVANPIPFLPTESAVVPPPVNQDVPPSLLKGPLVVEEETVYPSPPIPLLPTESAVVSPLVNQDVPPSPSKGPSMAEEEELDHPPAPIPLLPTESAVASPLVNQNVPLSSSEGPLVAEEEEEIVYPPAPTPQVAKPTPFLPTESVIVSPPVNQDVPLSSSEGPSVAEEEEEIVHPPAPIPFLPTESTVVSLLVNQDVPSEGPPVVEEEEIVYPPTPPLQVSNPVPFLPTANSYRSFYSTNMLLWWLPKSTSMYNICTRPS